MKKSIKKKLNRSGKEPCQICKVPRVLVEHHIHGRNIPDSNSSWNLVNICSNCHVDVHTGSIIIEDWIMTTKGLELSWHKPGEKGITGSDAAVYTY
ncbi:MAG: HNH endonuclease [Candidatus Cloacimonetes bacterium]|jgi:hypothetical protein|nr:HNH endonuclease [Candidatus Cloacimonadota bacterium]